MRNDAASVEIHADGEALDVFVARLNNAAPPLARVDAVTVAAAALASCAGFVIAESAGGQVRTAIGHDTATCPDCLAELFDLANRRYRHAFITCTHCGPRFTVVRRLPYDRPQTSLAPFPLCPECTPNTLQIGQDAGNACRTRRRLQRQQGPGRVQSVALCTRMCAKPPSEFWRSVRRVIPDEASYPFRFRVRTRRDRNSVLSSESVAITDFSSVGSTESAARVSAVS